MYKQTILIHVLVTVEHNIITLITRVGAMCYDCYKVKGDYVFVCNHVLVIVNYNVLICCYFIYLYGVVFVCCLLFF